jgi:starch phosphorylase
MLISKQDFKQDLIDELKESYGTELKDSSNLNIYLALGDIVRKYTTEDWIEKNKRYNSSKEKQVYYFSMEFLLGKLLESNLINLGIIDICKESLYDLNIDFNEINEIETDQGLGNSGLGRQIPLGFGVQNLRKKTLTLHFLAVVNT